ncbi:MAG: hypothetical protein COV75_07780 [Candidatus Omnitrophica bacterium CG11_big_fil_rev_8_21_14_0_20_63_9]|nr:MAG: hypothetical protein COV75_07780 [Candidatus Omnitrophica bacterium CG11_big_fil_rev_8_21_14_0_20_63_9]
MRDDPLGTAHVRAAGFPVVAVPKREDPAQTARVIRRHRPGRLITDLYPSSSAYLGRLRNAGAQVVCLTALGQLRAPADIVINGDVRFQGQRPRVNRLATQRYVGPDYFILRPQFCNGHGPRRRIARTASRILVTVGGVDPGRLIPKILRALECVTASLRITVVLGAPQKDMLPSGAKPVRILSGVKRMSELMRASDLAIASGGFTLYELAATGTPSVVLCQRPHQQQTAQAFERLGSCRCLGLGDQVTETRLAKVVTDLIRSPVRRRAMSIAGSSIVDGGGLHRVVEILTTTGRLR